jgi:hypothetical protein
MRSLVGGAITPDVNFRSENVKKTAFCRCALCNRLKAPLQDSRATVEVVQSVDTRTLGHESANDWECADVTVRGKRLGIAV